MFRNKNLNVIDTPYLTLQFAAFNLLGDDLGGLAVDLGANRQASAEDLGNGAFDSLGEGLGLVESLGDGQHLSEGNIAGAVREFFFLTVSGLSAAHLLNDHGGDAGADLDGGNSVLGVDFDEDTEALEGFAGFGDIFTDFLRVETEGTQLLGHAGGQVLVTGEDEGSEDDQLASVDLRWHL